LLVYLVSNKVSKLLFVVGLRFQMIVALNLHISHSFTTETKSKFYDENRPSAFRRIRPDDNIMIGFGRCSEANRICPKNTGLPCHLLLLVQLFLETNQKQQNSRNEMVGESRGSILWGSPV